jgi:hypothetical protein
VRGRQGRAKEDEGGSRGRPAAPVAPVRVGTERERPMGRGRREESGRRSRSRSIYLFLRIRTRSGRSRIKAEEGEENHEKPLPARSDSANLDR